MELSALLTKKALLVGGGTAATTTAVVVPVAVTQSNKANEELQVTWDLNLVMADSSLLTSFNTPGDCIKRSFPKVDTELEADAQNTNKKGFFHKPNSVAQKNAAKEYAAVDLKQDQNSLTSPDFACLMLNKPKDETSKEFRLEFTIKKDNWGYLWMSGIRKQASGKHLFFIREALVKEEGSEWASQSGLDAFYEVNENIPSPTFNPENFPGLKTRDTQECREVSGNTQCTEKSSNVAVWLPKDNGNAFLSTLEEDLSKSILRLGEDKDFDKRVSDNSKKRRSFFQDGTWFDDSGTQSQGPIFTFEKDQVFPNEYKGEWKDLFEYCKSSSGEEAFTSLCKSPN